jgi:O-Antigen ligase
VAAIAWGAFAFGAVYAWAYWPLVAAAAVVALLSVVSRAARPSLHLGVLAVALTLVAVAVVLQLVPVPSPWLQALSPRTLDVVRTVDLAAGAHPERHALSIAPHLTAAGLALFASFALLVIGAAHLFTRRGPRGIAHAVAIIGVLLALAAIIQKPLVTGKIYGVWTPEEGGNPFGPFVNRNHFAGWMLMALPLTLGLLAGGIARGMRHVRPESQRPEAGGRRPGRTSDARFEPQGAPTFRERVLWLSSPDASRVLLLAGAAAIMALSLVMTLSRSGMAAMFLALALTGAVTLRRLGGATRRTLAAGYVVFLAIAVTGWVGVDRVVHRFAQADWTDFTDRRGPWEDAAGIASEFVWSGTGFNTYGVATLFYQRHDLAHYYSAAHNDYLQLAAEGGVLLVVPAVLCVAAFGVIVWKRFKDETRSSGYWIRVGAVTGLAAIAIQETVEFSLQMPGNAVLFAVLCGIALHASGPSQRDAACRSRVAANGAPRFAPQGRLP